MIIHSGLNGFHPSVMQDFNMCLLHAKSEIPNNVMSEQNFMSCFVFCDVDSVNIKNDMIHGVFEPTPIHIALHFPKTRAVKHEANLGALNFFPIIYWGFLATRSGKNGVAIIAMEVMVDLEKALTLKMLKTNIKEFLQIHTLSYYQIYMCFFFSKKLTSRKNLLSPCSVWFYVFLCCSPGSLPLS